MWNLEKHEMHVAYHHVENYQGLEGTCSWVVRNLQGTPPLTSAMSCSLTPSPHRTHEHHRVCRCRTPKRQSPAPKAHQFQITTIASEIVYALVNTYTHILSCTILLVFVEKLFYKNSEISVHINMNHQEANPC